MINTTILYPFILIFFSLDEYPTTKFHQINEPQCTWSDWKLFECDATCGDGKRLKIREMKANNFYTGQCSEKDYKTEQCNLRPCPQGRAK